MRHLLSATGQTGPIAVLLALLLLAAPSTQAASLSANDLKEYQTAFQAVDRGRWDVALNHAARPTEQLPEKAVRWLYLQTSGSGASFEEITQFIADNPTWPRLEKLRRRAEEAMTDALPDRTILSFFQAEAPMTGNGFLLYAAALNRAGLADLLSAQAIRAWRELDMSGAEEHTFRKLYRQLVPMDDEIYRLDRLIWEGKYVAAERQSRRVPAAYRLLADARIRLAKRSGGVDAAINRVPPNLQDDPGLIYERMRWRRKKGRYEGAMELLAWPDMQSSFPEKWWKERAILARDLMEDGQYQRAYEIASQHRVPNGAGFADAEWFSGWVALRFLNDPERAFPHFRDMYNNVGYPVSRSRAAYWAGRAAEAAGKMEIAQQWYAVAAQHTASFYGQVAAMKLPQALRPRPLGNPVVAADRRQSFDAFELTRLVRMLAEIGADDTVKAFIWHMSRTYRNPGLLAMTAELAADVDRLDLAVFASRQAIKNEVVALAGFPVLPFNSSKIADLTIVHGLIRQESGFDIDAISSAGARGLMQLMPATAKLVSGWESVGYRRDALTSDYDYNVRLGSAYLADLLQKFDNVLPMALAGYNAGPHRVTSWVNRFGDPRSMDFEETLDWMESIPFHETRNYVQRVLENITVYRQQRSGRPELVSLLAGTG